MLWLSYQRYALLLTLLAALLPAGAALLPGWWALALSAPLSLWALRFAREIFSQYPKKLAKTRAAEAAIRAGAFSPAAVKRLAADPCSRVVARAILARAGFSRAERSALIARFAGEAGGEPLVLVDRTNGVVYTIDGGAVARAELPPEPTAERGGGRLHTAEERDGPA